MQESEDLTNVVRRIGAVMDASERLGRDVAPEVSEQLRKEMPGLRAQAETTRATAGAKEELAYLCAKRVREIARSL